MNELKTKTETTPLMAATYGSTDVSVGPAPSNETSAIETPSTSTPASSSTKRARLDHFDALRTIMAFLVMVHHYGYIYGFNPDGASDRLKEKVYDFPRVHFFLDRAAFFGVTYFFVLSGFMAQYTARSELTTFAQKREYLWRRSARLLLGYEAALFIMIAFNKWKLLGSTTGFLVNLFCVQSFFPLNDGTGYRDYYPNAYNEPAWFVSALLCCQVRL